MKKNLRRSIARILLLPVCLAALCAIGCAHAGSDAPADSEPVLLYVNGEPITQALFDTSVQSIVAAAPPHYDQTQIAEKMPTIRQRTRDQLILQKLIDQAITAEGIAPPEQEIDEQLQAEDQYLREARGLSLENFLKQTGRGMEDARAEIRRALAMRILIDRRLALQPPADEDAQQFYDQNKTRYTQHEAAQIHQLMTVFPSQKEVTDRDRLSAKHRIEALLERVSKGEDFATVASEGSEGPNAKGGGNLGWVVRQSSLPTEVLDAAFNTPVGELSPIVASPMGFHIIQVNERRPERIMPLDEIRDMVAEDIMETKRRAGALEVFENMRKEATITGPNGEPIPMEAPQLTE